jgi:hypothetical protein
MSQEGQHRGVRIHTTEGRVEGNLRLAPTLRTLDDLNMMSKHVITLLDACPENREWGFEKGALSISKASILFLQELGSPSVQSGASFGRFTRSALRLRVGPYDIQGFVHVPPGGMAIKRLEQGTHLFLSMTSVLVSGPDGEFTAAFLAVNRNHVIAAQEVQQPTGEEVAPFAVAAALD